MTFDENSSVDRADLVSLALERELKILESAIKYCDGCKWAGFEDDNVKCLHYFNETGDIRDCPRRLPI